ncbi:MAG: nicotinamide mononucleotide transporter [Holophagales bacterium]|nr:nicotinamide mononucleotide transporter [Holophagales bacterium]
MSPYEIAGFVFGVLAVWLTAKESPWCWPTGLVNVSLYIVVFWQAKLYADMGLQVVYVVVCLYGWWEWLHGGAGGGRLSVSRAPRRTLAALTVAGAAFAVFLGFALHRGTDAALPFWDSTTTAYSLVAQWLQTKKQIETWWFWIAVDVVYIGVYAVKGLWLTALLYAIFLALCLVGLKEWKRSLATPRAEGSLPEAA